jgi:hypothetical protein
MIRKALTYFTILAITALPVQLVSASAENVSMQMSMAQQLLANNECIHERIDKNLSLETEQNFISNACCDDQSSSCQGCNDVTHATTAMTSPVIAMVKTSLLISTELFANNSLLHGIPQKNLLRPPRTHI